MLLLVEELFDAKERLARLRRGLLREFEEEFPPQKGARGGYLLTGRMCGKNGCRECPHSLVWRWYRRPGRKAIYSGERLKKLPANFWTTRRSEKTKERFRYYEATAEELNARWKWLQRKTLSLQAQIRAALRSLNNSE